MLKTFPSLPSRLAPVFAVIPPPPVIGSNWQVRVCELVPSLYAQQLVPPCYSTSFALCSPSKSHHSSQPRCDTLNRPTCHDSSLDWSFKQGCFGAPDRLHRSLIVSKLSDDLFVCVACNYIAFWSLGLENLKGVEGGGGGSC